MFVPVDKKEIVPLEKYEVVYRKPVRPKVPNGAVLGFVGEQTSGKTISALQMGYLDLAYEKEILAAGFPDIVEALKNKLIPEVKKIVMIESEHGTENMSRPIEDFLVGDIFYNKVELVDISAVTDDVIMDAEGIKDNPETLEIMDKAFHTYMKAFEDLHEKKERNTGLIVDSMSLFRELNDLRSLVIFNKRTKGKGEESVKAIAGQKWTIRNQYNRKVMLLIRDMPSWKVLTFREVDNSEWVQKAYNKPPTSFQWNEDVGFQMDMGYHFTKDPLTNEFYVDVMPRYCRYLKRGIDIGRTDKKLKIGSKFAIFPIISDIIQIMKAGVPE